MKRYTKPETKTVNIRVNRKMMTTSEPDVVINRLGSVNATDVESRQDYAWDIWGTAVDDEE